MKIVMLNNLQLRIISPISALKKEKNQYLNAAIKNNGLYTQCPKIYLNRRNYNEEKLSNALKKIANREDTADFEMNVLLRMMYLDKSKDTFPKN